MSTKLLNRMMMIFSDMNFDVVSYWTKEFI